MQLFNLKFMDALSKLSSDFNIRLDLVSSDEAKRKALLRTCSNEMAETQKNRNTYVCNRLCEYYRWLNTQEDSEKVRIQRESTERMIDRMVNGKLVITYDIDAMLNSMRAVILGTEQR